MKVLELKIPPVALTIIIAFLMWGFAELFPATKFSSVWNIVIASAVSCIGVIFSLLGVLEFKKEKTTVDPRVPDQTSSLVITGVYTLSRNPMYIGFLFMLIAWAFYLSQILVFVFLPLFIIYMNWFQITPEERFMMQKFGEEYTLYMSKVRRWI